MLPTMKSKLVVHANAGRGITTCSLPRLLVLWAISSRVALAYVQFPNVIAAFLPSPSSGGLGA